ncbi:hypothetical protein [Robertmurraya kyonggiensis]|uniref:Beta-carotene 15,15'-monooxygenase n=1 Tax=Robertmurraya kyonggiensis TaxID=1037680 RepID=A0A4U1D9W9_9BACI|nr:hypothetical protein [Robertmurraya kyonggiensis]TKC19365.1 hypothetical protein FA727_07450 [Robertmurraya kyonggiensis]
MVLNIKKNRVSIYLFLITLIILTNYLLYNLESMQPLSTSAVLGSIFDFLIVLPIITYFLIIRKKYSLKYMGLVFLAGYGLAYLIIPNHHLESYSFLPYIIAVSEGALALLELYLIYTVVKILPKLLKNFKNIDQKNSYFLLNLRKCLEEYFPNKRMVYVLLSDVSMFYYSLFSWKRKIRISSGQTFTYHKKTSVLAVYIMIIHATVLESVGLHYLLHEWNGIIAFILLLFNIYAVLFSFAEIQAIRLTPFLLTEKMLYLQVGITSSMEITLNQIKEFKHYDGPEKLSRTDQKNTHDARVIDFIQEKPMFEIILKDKEKVHLIFGITREVDRIIFNVDDSQTFYRALQNKLELNT